MNANVNPFERIQRMNKVARLLAEADRIESATGATKIEHLVFWRNATEQQWAQLSLQAGIKPASKITRAQFLERMSERAGVI